MIGAQASLVAQWMLVGFVHGVLNTDNMTISGETIDFGPCAFMEAFDPATVFSSIDQGGRYAYANQPAAAEWNLARFAEALLPLFADDQEQAVAVAMEALDAFRRQYDAALSAGRHTKLGLPGDLDDAVASPLVDELLTLLQDGRVDYTSFFRHLGAAARGDEEPARRLFLDLAAFDSWAERWRACSPKAVVVAHSLGCWAGAEWILRTRPADISALMVAVPDGEGASFPRLAAPSFLDLTAQPLGVRAVLVASDDDAYCSIERARDFASGWGADWTCVGARGHLNSASDLGDWPEGRGVLAALDAKQHDG